MTNKVEAIVSDNSVELVIDYDFVTTKGYYIDPQNISTWIPESVIVEINIVELILGNEGIDITTQLSEKQKEFIISKLTY